MESNRSAEAQELSDRIPQAGSQGRVLDSDRPLHQLQASEDGRAAIVGISGSGSNTRSISDVWTPELVRGIIGDVDPLGVAVTGRWPFWGSFRIRGVTLHQLFGYELLHQSSLDRFDTCIIIKDAPETLPVAKRYILDPMDCFFGSAMPVARYWEGYFDSRIARIRKAGGKTLESIEVFATSPAVATIFSEFVNPSSVHIVPHWPDCSVRPREWQVSGSCVYHGERSFFPETCQLRQELCQKLGPIYNQDFRAWNGVFSVMSVRSTNRQLDSQCKPQVKLANALAANLPCLCSDAAPVRSLATAYPNHLEVIEVSEDLKSVADRNGLDGLLWILPKGATYREQFLRSPAR